MSAIFLPRNIRRPVPDSFSNCKACGRHANFRHPDDFGGTMAHKLHHPHRTHPHSHQQSLFPTRRDFLSSLISAAVLAPWALGQDWKHTPVHIAERFRQVAEERTKEGLAAPYRGTTTNGQ